MLVSYASDFMPKEIIQEKEEMDGAGDRILAEAGEGDGIYAQAKGRSWRDILGSLVQEVFPTIIGRREYLQEQMQNNGGMNV